MDKVTDGLKNDGDKLRLDLLSPEFIEAVGAVMTYGAEKYGEGNYKESRAKAVQSRTNATYM